MNNLFNLRHFLCFYSFHDMYVTCCRLWYGYNLVTLSTYWRNGSGSTITLRKCTRGHIAHKHTLIQHTHTDSHIHKTHNNLFKHHCSTPIPLFSPPPHTLFLFSGSFSFLYLSWLTLSLTSPSFLLVKGPLWITSSSFTRITSPYKL